MDNEKMDIEGEDYSFFDDEPHWGDIFAVVVWFTGRLAFFMMAAAAFLMATCAFFRAVVRPVLAARGWCS